MRSDRSLVHFESTTQPIPAFPGGRPLHNLTTRGRANTDHFVHCVALMQHFKWLKIMLCRAGDLGNKQKSKQIKVETEMLYDALSLSTWRRCYCKVTPHTPYLQIFSLSGHLTHILAFVSLMHLTAIPPHDARPRPSDSDGDASSHISRRL